MVTAKGEDAGVATEKVPPMALTDIVLVAEAVTVLAESSHSTSTSTLPTAVPVRLTVAIPEAEVVPEAALKVPLPVLVAATE